MLDTNDFLRNIDNKILIIENKKVRHTINPYNIDSIVLNKNIVAINLDNNKKTILSFKSKADAKIGHDKLTSIYETYMVSNTPMVIDREIDNYYKNKLVQYYISFGDLPTVGIPNMLYVTKSDNRLYLWDSNINQYVLLNGSGTSQFVYDQILPLDNWIINHNLFKYPTVIIIQDDNGNRRVINGEIIYVDNMTINIRFNLPISGHAYLQ